MIWIKIGIALLLIAVMIAALTTFFRRQSSLQHWKRKTAETVQRIEIHGPANVEEAVDYLCISGYDDSNPTLEQSLQMVEANLSDDPCDYGQLLGEFFACSEAYQNPEKAYLYYHVGLSQGGYSVGFRDENHDPPYYCGPTGDFRNESMVSDLVITLGWERVKEIDLQAKEWLIRNGFDFQEFLDDPFA